MVLSMFRGAQCTKDAAPVGNAAVCRPDVERNHKPPVCPLIGRGSHGENQYPAAAGTTSQRVTQTTLPSWYVDGTALLCLVK